MLFLGVATLLIGAGCGAAPELDTRTFELQYLQPDEAADMVQPYVYHDRPDAPGMVTVFSAGITVRETADNLEKIARVLEEYDRPKPGVRLLFQLIQANGAGAADPRISDVEQALKELFRFEGYELVTETQLGAVVGSGSTQVFGHEGVQYAITAHIQNVRERAGAGAVELHVELMSDQIGRAMTTSMTVPVGQTVVLGSTQPDPERAALILTVRPELVTLSEAGS
jgi:hypothetical protein